jgi:hypothetical protein
MADSISGARLGARACGVAGVWGKQADIGLAAVLLGVVVTRGRPCGSEERRSLPGRRRRGIDRGPRTHTSVPLRGRAKEMGDRNRRHPARGAPLPVTSA